MNPARFREQSGGQWIATPTAQRVLKYVNTTDPDKCWEWQGGRTQTGYGNSSYMDDTGKQRCIKAHRLSYQTFVGPIPEGLTLDHLCENKACINPAHLEPVPNGVNARRSPRTRASINAAKTHCPYGHPYDEVNTFINVRGSRECRICIRARRK